LLQNTAGEDCVTGATWGPDESVDKAVCAPDKEETFLVYDVRLVDHGPGLLRAADVGNQSVRAHEIPNPVQAGMMTRTRRQ
jgi:hypothetical protein